MKSDAWRGCYDGGWADLIVPEAFAHPAKYSRALIARIYEHARAEGWLAPGDTVLDPFGGVALGGLDAMRLGLNWVGCELEAKFVALGGQNIELWQRRYGHTPGWGTARLIQGDSRKLAEVVAGAGAMISSPPFGAAQSGGGIMRDGYQSQLRPDLPPDWIAKRTYAEGVSSSDPANLDRLPATPRGLALALSSPPYAETVRDSGDGIDWGKATRGGHKPGMPRYASTAGAADGYGVTPGQLGAMPAGTPPSAVVSSPPFCGSGTDGKGEHCLKTNRNRQVIGKAGTAPVNDLPTSAIGYGQSPGNLGNLPPGDPAAVIASPPFEGCLAQGGSKMSDEFIRKHNETYGMSHITRRNNICAPDYGDSAGQTGAMAAADFWSASRVILEQVYAVLRPGGHAIFVTKDFVRAKARVPFSDQWQALCEAVGFRLVCAHRAMLVSGSGEQQDAFGQHKTLKRERKSFFRRLAEAKGSPRIDHEDVRCFVKPNLTSKATGRE